MKRTSVRAFWWLGLVAVGGAGCTSMQPAGGDGGADVVATNDGAGADVLGMDGAADASDALDAAAEGGAEAGDAAGLADAADGVDAADAADAADASDDGVPGDAPLADGCVPATEVCNDRDDDCDGATDEDLPTITCGTGACTQTIPSCAFGTPVQPSDCSPLPPQPEVCNGIDDSCNGVTDDVPIVPCGLGACQTTPASVCNGRRADACTPGTPSAEVCGDGVDNDCDGVVDDGCNCARYVRAGATGTGLSPADPAGSIQATISELSRAGGGTVCVAYSAATPCAPSVFTEDIDMAPGVSVLGGFRPGGTWTRLAACETKVFGTGARESTVVFGAGLARTTRLDGMTIVGRPTGAAGAVSTAITVQSGGSLTNNKILGGQAETSYGLRLAGTGVADLLVAGNTIRGADTGGSTTVNTSVGIDAVNAGGEIRGNAMIEGGSAPTSVGVRISGGPGFTVADNPDISGSGDVATGLSLQNAPGTLITRNQIYNRFADVNGVGLDLGVCNGPGVQIFGNALIAGARTTADDLGMLITAGIRSASTFCPVVIYGNGNIHGAEGTSHDSVGVLFRQSGTGWIAGNAEIVGATAASSLGSAAGIAMIDSGASIHENDAIVGAAASVAYAQGVTVQGNVGYAVIDRNTITAGVGAGSAAGVVVGVANIDEARVTNNLVVVPSGYGLQAQSGLVRLEANTLVAPAAASPPSIPTELLRIEATSSVVPTVFVNNDVLACLDAASNRTAVAEQSIYADPGALLNNDLYGCATLYRDRDTDTALTSIAAVNALTDVSYLYGNLSVDPHFASDTDRHLQPDSPLIDQGTPTSVASHDFDGQPRPMGAALDIGFDEVR